MRIPHWIVKSISEEDITRVETAVSALEGVTGAEVIAIVVRRSSTVRHVFPMVLLILAVIYLLVDKMQWLPIWWGSSWHFVVEAAVLLVLGWVISSLAFVQRLLVPKEDRVHQVEQRADLEFVENGVIATKSRVGVLLFVSLLEKRAVIKADRGLVERIDDKVWDEILAHLSQKLKTESLSDALISTLNAMGEVLSRVFPKFPHDRNELPNDLIIKE
ncbi:MAG: hypothetical protein COT74_13190 [Bdellovibrionales bacterium CG10_big_fil_rev_8_21_14_0_10_45_34]|nr:MAG: hypothetical protein COT74_13190 [Bdellovibrionales bacterium CG10_big_fil_rev_8_21_14_0_10_45_34]